MFVASNRDSYLLKRNGSALSISVTVCEARPKEKIASEAMVHERKVSRKGDFPE
jgi:hypothetical protein